MTLQAEMPDAPHLGVILQEAGDGQPVGILSLHAQRQRLQPAQDQVSGVRVGDAAEHGMGLAQPCGEVIAADDGAGHDVVVPG